MSYQEAVKHLQMSQIPQHFLVGDSLMLLNISLSPDGAQEYAVYKLGSANEWIKFESITVSWMQPDRLLEFLEMNDKKTIGEILNPLTDKPITEAPLIAQPYAPPIVSPERWEQYLKAFKEFQAAY